MLAQPTVIQRPDQPYVAIKALVTMQALGEVLPALHPEVDRWLRGRGAVPAGDPFFKFNLIDMEGELEVEVGFPVSPAVGGDERVSAGVLPAGRYATMSYTGAPDGLVEATAALLDWGKQSGVHWDVTRTPAGERWGARLEIYEAEPPDDIGKWTTQLAFRLAD